MRAAPALLSLVFAWALAVACSAPDPVLRNGQGSPAGGGGAVAQGGGGGVSPLGGTGGVASAGAGGGAAGQGGGGGAAGGGAPGTGGMGGAVMGGAGGIAMGGAGGAATGGAGGVAMGGAGGVANMGGSGGVAPLAGTAPDCATAVPSGARISDFADGSLAVLGLEGRPSGGTWRVVSDGSGGAASVAALMSAISRCNGSAAMRFLGTGFTGWGALAQGIFGNGTSTDVSAYKGLRFSLRASAPLTVRLKVPDRNSYNGAGVCTKCDDHFGRDLAVTTEWREWNIPFSGLAQEGKGVPQSPAFDAKTMYGVEFFAGKGPFELWVDDVSLLP